MGNRRWKDALLAAAEAAHAIDLLQGLGRGPAGRSLYVLAYHRVETPGANAWLDPADASATPRQFSAQLELLARRYHPVTLDDVLAAHRGLRPLPRDAVLLTVDDGYRNFADEIFPACARFGIRPVLFLATGCVGGGFYWWDQVYQIVYHSGQAHLDTPAGRLALVTPADKRRARRELLFALKRLPAEQRLDWVSTAHAALVPPPANIPAASLSWDELRELRRAGVDVAPHTHSHPILSRLPLSAVRAELRASRDLIQRELGGCPPAFALPDGQPFSYNPAVIDLLHAEGVELIFSMLAGRADLQAGGPALLPRLGVWRALSLPGFHYRLTPPGAARRA